VQIDIVQFDREVCSGTYGRWLEEWGNQCRYLLPDYTGSLLSSKADAVLLLGGHMGVNDRRNHPMLNHCHAELPLLVEQGKPILAICLGAQLLADALGGQALTKQRGERSVRQISLTEAGCRDPLFQGVSNPFSSFQWHNDSFDLPETATHLALTESCPGQAFRCQNSYGLQFHPEVDEQIIAGWCQRAKVDETALDEFRESRVEYLAASRRILKNFLEMIE